LQDPKIQGKVVALLKRFLSRYPPSSETLLYLEHFASSDASAQSLLFLRSLVQAQLRRGGAAAAPAAVHDSVRSSRAGSFASSFASFDAPVPLTVSNLFVCLSSFSCSCFAWIAFLIPFCFKGNFWLLGRSDAVLPELPIASSTRTFFDWRSEEDPAHSALGIDVFAAPTCDRIAIVAEFKMQSGLKGARDHMQKKRPAPKAVVFDQQKPVQLSDEEFRKLLAVVTNEDACGRERHMMASKVLLKVIMDGFVMLSPAAAAKRALQAMLKLLFCCLFLFFCLNKILQDCFKRR
jgi:hypothetical protein